MTTVHRASSTDGTTRSAAHHDWRAAGEAWGTGADDWSCLFEHYAIDVLMAVLPRLGVGPSTTLLDIACGAGLSVRIAQGAGATVSGIDASEELIAVARARTPTADLRVGSMFALPWADESFDAAVSINGIWGGCDAALDEAFRVLRPGGRLAISFWGKGPPLDIRDLFRVFAVHAPDAHRRSMRALNDISVPGVAESMLAAHGFEVLGRDGRTSVVEWPDEAIAWRAVTSLGPAVPALRTNDGALLRRELFDVLERCRDERGVYRIRSDQQFVIARRR
jgi:SAM-dependent methyltransferase